ncbi:MAG: helix-turn-helix transcriptional regulator [Planctomycetes bacterium]|nr:helix-turn-helix transcriptional regulator [Planctomycetota bacterium]
MPVIWYSPLLPAGPVQVHGLGIDEPMPPGRSIDRPAGSDEWLIMHFHDAVEVALDGAVREVPPHTLVVWPPGARQWFGCNRRWTHSWMFCSGARLAACIRSSGLEPLKAHAQTDATIAARYLSQIHLEITRPADVDGAIIEGLLALYLREAFRESFRAAPTLRRAAAIPARMLSARQLIDGDPTQPLTLRRLAQAAGLSRSQFSAEFRRCFGTTPIRYVLDLRLRRARTLLTDRNLSVGDAARRCGFADGHYFARQFRTRFGMSPRDSRR